MNSGPSIPLAAPDWPASDPDVDHAIQSAVADGSWGRYHGPHVAALESELAAFHGVEFALTCASGTLAVELALRAIPVRPGDEVIVGGYDYPANLLSVLATDAVPVLVDVTSSGCVLDVANLEPARTPATRAVLVSHLHGDLVDMPVVREWGDRHGVAVIEDAAQSPGAFVGGRRAGTWGDLGVLSFGGSKLLTAGRGGAIISSCRRLAQRVRVLCHRAGNQVYPLSEIQAAALLPQLRKLDSRNQQRQESVAAILDELDDLSGLSAVVRRFFPGCEGNQPVFYKLGFRCGDSPDASRLRDDFANRAIAEGVALAAGFPAAHIGRSPKRFRRVGSLDNAEALHHSMLVLHHPILLGTREELQRVADTIRRLYHDARQTAGLPT